MKKVISFFTCVFLFLTILPFSYSIEPNYVLQIFNTGDYPVLISDNHNVLFENFTATWCGWCHYSYEIFDSLLEKFGKQIINIRYHNQDELVMPDIAERAGYYKVNGYPTMLFNGNRKIVGADETTYPAVESIVASILEKPAKLGVYTTGFQDGNLLRMTSVLQSFSKEALTGNFLSIFSESNVLDNKGRKYDYVSRSVFPNFKGIKLTIEPGKIYIIQYARPVMEGQKGIDFEVVSFFQDHDTKEVFNSCFFKINSLTVTKSEPSLFAEEVRRDTSIVLFFQEGLVLGSINSAKMMIVSNQEEMIFLDPVYDRMTKTLTLYPLELLKPQTGYFLLILGGDNSLLSINKKRLQTDIIIPFHTSHSPELKLNISENDIDFGEIVDIDLPQVALFLKEIHDLPMRFKFVASSKWIEISESETIDSSIVLTIKVNPLHMHPGINQGNLTIITILGKIVIPIQAILLSNEFPHIRFTNYLPHTLSQSIVLHGRTNGYKLFLGKKEINVDNEGFFKVTLQLAPDYNFFLFQAVNMQRKTTNQLVTIYRFSQ